jgi:catechol 2,3-dioxygenase-like lactoylglutathione lyase family enzyme
MLSSYNPVATLPTSDLSKAKAFYQDTVGLTVSREGPEGVTYNCGSGSVFLYESSYAGTNKATALSFDVPEDQFDAEVEALRGKGVEFSTFELEGMTWSDGVATGGGGDTGYPEMKSVWFSDPDGNILNVSTGEF